MIDPRKDMIVIDGQIKTSQIVRCSIGQRGGRCEVVFINKPYKTYSYSASKVARLTNPVLFDPQHCLLYHNGRQLGSLAFIAVFQQGRRKFWYIEYQNGTCASYLGSEIRLVKSCLADKQAQCVFEYLRSVAAINPLKSEDSDTPLLLRQYRSIDIVGDDRAAAPYLNPQKFRPHTYMAPSLIYPFGCNASQQKAIQAAFENQISIIQGPPGTGKTQTILNIVANILKQGKTVMVVSNNNSAIANVAEKMERYEMGFVTALLGSRMNKEVFISTQEIDKAIPAGIGQWRTAEADSPEYMKSIDEKTVALLNVFAKQERLALARQELDSLKVERVHFEQETEYDERIKLYRRLSSEQLMALWNELQVVVENKRYSGIFAGIVNAIRDYRLRRKLQRLFSGLDHKPSRQDIVSLIPIVQYRFYAVKEEELMAEIESLEHILTTCNAESIMKRLQQDSLCYLRNLLSRKYGEEHERPIFHCFTPEFIDEYPVIFSTAFSSRMNFRKETVFDYVIMDEASQISSETGVLALMCARNAVIVGDSMQLPNVVTEEDRLRLWVISVNGGVDERYDCADNSFLQSVIRVLPDAPQVLLREHYRCHPKIINFCNQKFYGGKLVIMTQDKGEKDVITAVRTVAGNHSRGTLNLREVEVVAREVVPMLSCEAEGIGIIAPYNAQVNALRDAVDEHIDVATVHKFQGREKEAIIMSAVDDSVTEFSDDPNLLNVAVSRARQRFCLVVSGNEQCRESNISDLLAYIRYNECAISESNIRSIFDLLYDRYAEARKMYLKKHKRISEYDSENLTFAMLEDVIEEFPAYRHLGIVCHYPLRQLLREVTSLAEDDRAYALHPATHIDFLLYNRISKRPVLAIETDGYGFHKPGTAQSIRDDRKNRILAVYGIPLLRLSTVGSGERERVRIALLGEIRSGLSE